MHGLLHQHQQEIKKSDDDFYETLDKGLDAIKVRSQGLYQFTQSYRKLTGIPKLSLQKTNIRDIIDRVSVLIGNKLRERGIKFKVSAANISVMVDPGLMEHVLINLLLNAMDAVEATIDPSIEIATSVDHKGTVFISVRDNGEGIEEATAEKIFIPFFTTRANGSGIGLALTKQILHLHHADIHFTSEKGKGSEFVIVI
jgi:two-component system, NtrC family, nitrogen regulation sensor histidine kinase NtrY